MITKRFFFICTLPSVIAGCAEFYGSQPPAPVYESRPVAPRSAPLSRVVAEQPKEVLETVEVRPLQESVTPVPVEIKAEPLSPEQAQSLLTPEQERELAALEQAQQASGHTPPMKGPTASQPSPDEPSLPQAAPIAPPKPAFEPLKSFADLSPAVSALVVAANQNSAKGNIQSATTTIERAIRIEPRNATLYYKLALLRLKESNPRLAEDLAKKSALLASNDTRLKKHSWLLIAKAREMQKNFEGAKEAKAKADKF